MIGARVRGREVSRLLLVRVWRGQQVLVLTEQGALVEVFPDVPRWMLESGLEPSDSQRGPRSARCARNRGVRPRADTGHGRVDAARGSRRVPARPGSCVGARAPRPGRHRRSHVAATRNDRRDPSLPSPRPPLCRGRARTVALPQPSRPASQQTSSPLAVPTTTRDGLLDVMLRWLSEQEDGVTSTARFRDTWAWLTTTTRDGDPADWRLALYHLQILGHVEVDYGRSRVGVAPPVANVLTRGRGFAALCGARPESLCMRWSRADGTQSPPKRLRSLGRAPARPARRRRMPSVGPVAIYLEWDPDQHDLVDRGLRQLGVRRRPPPRATCCSSLVPGLQRRLEAGQRFDVAPLPGRRGQAHATATSGSRPGRSTAEVCSASATRRGPVFAWCEGAGRAAGRRSTDASGSTCCCRTCRTQLGRSGPCCTATPTGPRCSSPATRR